ncbi:hypothetical protein CHUAL_006993 [Chamberlinius hualienensis]
MWSIIVLLTAMFVTSGSVTDVVSPGHLLDIFTDIYMATGTFPDDKDEYTQLAIVNRPFSHCLSILARKVGNGGQIGVDKCYLTNVESPELFWLRHAGEGYITLGTPWNRCIGAGSRYGAWLWTGDWCEEDIFKFSIVNISSDGFKLRHKATGHFVTAPKETKQQVTITDESVDDTSQLWAVCDPSGILCWPKQEITTTPVPTTVKYDVIAENITKIDLNNV